jgi:hypothetical protein
VIRDKIKDLLKKIVLYQLGKYPREALDRELTEFILKAEDYVCSALKRNGLTCYREYKYDYGPEEARKLCYNDYENVMTLSRVLPRFKVLAELILISLEFENIIHRSLSDKILFFDKLIHLEHYGSEVYEETIFGVNIRELKAEVDTEIMRELYKERIS